MKDSALKACTRDRMKPNTRNKAAQPYHRLHKKGFLRTPNVQGNPFGRLAAGAY
ncbi:hypothetical protein YDYSY3_22670 [Paenibacillus chitinolyticus]|nr:hypothetical protein YDYSY3_22670 [Paenibacillus chitinolyticus]